VTVRALAGVLLVGVLTGCGGSPSPEAALREAVADATSAANERDADAVRAEARRIEELARVQRAELGADRADRLTALAGALDEAADQIDPAFLDAQRRAREDAEREAQRRADEQAAQQAAVDKAAREQAAREQAAREQAAREQAAREQAAREQAAREQAARERGRGDEDKDGDDDKGKGKDKKDDD
jgi:hypothetical protein